MLTRFRRKFMRRRPEWNVLGPRLPAWFRPTLKCIDPSWVLQFIPPDDVVPRGVDARMYPHGVWAVCRRMRNTGWLCSRWVWALSDQHGYYQPPGMDSIHLLRRARDLGRRNKTDHLEREFDRSINAIRREQCDQSRARLISKLAGSMRRDDMTQFHGRRVSLHGAFPR